MIADTEDPQIAELRHRIYAVITAFRENHEFVRPDHSGLLSEHLVQELSSLVIPRTRMGMTEREEELYCVLCEFMDYLEELPKGHSPISITLWNRAVVARHAYEHPEDK